MNADSETGTQLISDLVFLTQRASAETCDIAARTIERQTQYYLSKYPGEIVNAYAFQLASEKLCECIRSLQEIAPGTGNEILTKRKALDFLLTLSNELEHCAQKPSLEIQEPALIFAKSA